MIGDNIDNEFDDLDDLPELKELESLEKELNDTLYKVGYDAGYFQGFKSGHDSANPQVEDLIFDAAVIHVVEYIKSIDIVDKETLIAGIETLRRTGAE